VTEISPNFSRPKSEIRKKNGHFHEIQHTLRRTFGHIFKELKSSKKNKNLGTFKRVSKNTEISSEKIVILAF
jgi:hypothetical protein